MRRRRWVKSLISYLGRWAWGDLWWERAISILQWERWRLAPIVWSMRGAFPPPPKRKGTFFLLRCDCSVPLLILKDDGAVFSPVSPLDFVVFTVPQTDSCKSIKSSERSTGFGCDNDLQKTTNGERMSLTSTRACTWTHTGTPSTPLYSKLAEQSPHSYQPWPSPPYCASCRLRWQHPS